MTHVSFDTKMTFCYDWIWMRANLHAFKFNRISNGIPYSRINLRFHKLGTHYASRSHSTILKYKLPYIPRLVGMHSMSRFFLGERMILARDFDKSSILSQIPSIFFLVSTTIFERIWTTADSFRARLFEIAFRSKQNTFSLAPQRFEIFITESSKLNDNSK